MRVCQKVQDKGTTTYNEVADELVNEQLESEARGEVVPGDEPHGPKNIRRRVYDALNVLMAMNIIAKDKKEIRWIGLPASTPADHLALEDAIVRLRARIDAKRARIRDLILQQVAFKNLMKHNGARNVADTPTLHLPFIVVNTDQSTVIKCQMTPDK